MAPHRYSMMTILMIGKRKNAQLHVFYSYTLNSIIIQLSNDFLWLAIILHHYSVRFRMTAEKMILTVSQGILEI